jgi:hypothetical protein
MKRHPALALLSRGHQHTLAVAQRLRRATPDTAAQAVAAFLAVWDVEERQHFRLEEEVLLPSFAGHSDPEHPLILRVLVDHLRIRCAADRLATDRSVSTLHALGEILASHVHLEAHELFPPIEKDVPEADLSVLGARLRSDSP